MPRHDLVLVEERQHSVGDASRSIRMGLRHLLRVDPMNPFARPYACPVCRDSRMRTRSSRASKTDLVACDVCGLMNTEEYEKFRRDAWIRDHKPPTICELDLTPAELTVYKQMRMTHPKVSKTTVLSWMEGQRYDPSKDEEFLAEAREKFKAVEGTVNIVSAVFFAIAGVCIFAAWYLNKKRGRFW